MGAVRGIAHANRRCSAARRLPRSRATGSREFYKSLNYKWLSAVRHCTIILLTHSVISVAYDIPSLRAVMTGKGICGFGSIGDPEGRLSMDRTSAARTFSRDNRAAAGFPALSPAVLPLFFRPVLAAAVLGLVVLALRANTLALFGMLTAAWFTLSLMRAAENAWQRTGRGTRSGRTVPPCGGPDRPSREFQRERGAGLRMTCVTICFPVTDGPDGHRRSPIPVRRFSRSEAPSPRTGSSHRQRRSGSLGGAFRFTQAGPSAAPMPREQRKYAGSYEKTGWFRRIARVKS